MSTNELNPQDLINVRAKHMEQNYYRELAQLSAWLFIGVLALMTFLLTVGLQHPQPLFSYFCYASLIVLPLNLLIFAVANMMAMMAMSRPARATKVADEAPADKDDDKKDDKSEAKAKPAKSKADATTAWVKALRLTQQILFILSLVAVTGFGLVAAHIFFAPPAASTQQVQQ